MSGRSGSAASRLGSVLHVHADLGHALDALERLANGTGEAGVVLGAEEQGHADLAVARGGDVPHLLRVVHASAGAWVGNRGQRLGEAGLEGIGHREESQRA